MSNYADPEGFAEWEVTVPESYRRDPIWKTPAYRYGLWLSDLVKRDAKVVLSADTTRYNDADQLSRAVGAISSNLAEGYGRSSGGERARYYDYALATTRESRDWYFKVRDVLGTDVMERDTAYSSGSFAFSVWLSHESATRDRNAAGASGATSARHRTVSRAASGSSSQPAASAANRRRAARSRQRAAVTSRLSSVDRDGRVVERPPPRPTRDLVHARMLGHEDRGEATGAPARNHEVELP